RLAMPLRPLTRMTSMALALSPSASSRAFLTSSMPAPVISRISLMSAAVYLAIYVSLGDVKCRVRRSVPGTGETRGLPGSGRSLGGGGLVGLVGLGGLRLCGGGRVLGRGRAAGDLSGLGGRRLVRRLRG